MYIIRKIDLIFFFQAEELKNELYCSGWENIEKNSLKKMILLMMINFEIKFEISAGLFGSLSLDLFIEVGINIFIFQSNKTSNSIFKFIYLF